MKRATRIEAVMAAIRARIAARADLPGARLPSVRLQAQAMGCSVSTVVEAYERLAAENLISPRPGSGFYVCGRTAPLTLAEIDSSLDREVDPLWVSRQSLETGAPLLKPGCGWLPAEWMYEAGLRRALRTTARADVAALTDYSTPLGLPALRQLLARRMSAADVSARPEQIMLTDSGTQAIDLICRYFLKPGDVVLVDDPCYFNFHALLRAHRVRAVGIAYTEHGPDVEAFGAAVREQAPRLYITNSGIHNPTGATLSAVVAHRLLKLADDSDLVIVEDDIFSDFETSIAPRLAAFDGLARVIQIGSFSKSISASLRCGYVAARADWIEGLTDLKIATSFGGSQLASIILQTALTDSGYRKHMEGVRSRLAQAMSSTIARLDAIDVKPWIVPQAGMFLWCQLPEGSDAASVARSCLKRGVVLAPGNVFSSAQTANRFVRFNVAQATDRRVYDTLAQALSSNAAAD